MNGKSPFVRIKDLILVFLKIGTIGFGGGPGMLALIRKYLVSGKKWITDDDLATAVTLGQMIPGPFVPNYVEYIGYRLRGIKGMISSVVAFLFPGFIAVLLLSYLYFHTQKVLMINDIFIWIQPIIIGILAWACFDMGRLYLKDTRSIIIAVFALLASLFKIMPIIIVLACGFAGIVFSRKPKIAIFSLLPIYILLGISPFVIKTGNLGLLALIFLEVGLLIFGGGYAAIPFIAQEVVIRRAWLTNQELLTGVALSQVTPGPVALLSTFVGYKISGFLGAFIATLSIFLPSTIILLLILSVYHYFIKSNRNKAISDYAKSFIDGVKPAIIGFLISATILLGSNHNVVITHSITITLLKVFMIIISFLLLTFIQTSPAILIIGGVLVGFVLTRIGIKV
jgi:chromate transporter